MVKPTYLVDASVYIFRAWHSMPDEFVDPSGRPTNAVYGFARFLCELIEETQAEQLAVAFDGSLQSSFRNTIYPAYKANRDPTPEALKQQFAWCRDLARSVGLPVHISTTHEADDLIASLAAFCRQQDQSFCVVSGDKDLAQLIGERDTWWDFARRRRLNAAGVAEHFGVRPEQLADFLALTGDSVDNIPGVPGIGPKTAAALLGHFNDLDTLFSRLDEIAWLSALRGAKTLAGKLREHEAAARLARQLTGLADDLSELHQPEALTRQPGNADQLDVLLDSLGFGRGLRERLHRVCLRRI